ncbi:S-adenosyl-L-methionine-dependent methyltransferase [Lepidopterella palustris CBS 459.81]|uniref:S-adenosyl-L-methionine-dependent methyltransferase n=1 Tax=Lepidopterella palustris CBS 459.81 TaxID=1314670 RepID=A0A8E2E451_9PEZI|nr:S-adenosyl-L-methionine-dependent methyltransferase [Lepidopterella palustris CBS 459.81]
MSNHTNYGLRRDYNASSRLNYQAYLWKDSLGYVAHPKIPKLPPGSRVADVGTGTGIWLLQLAQELGHAEVQLDGYDISIAQCPTENLRPGNVSFTEWNAFEEIPPGTYETYDLVHIRLFGINVQNNDPSKVIRNVLCMLKPGGWLQWEEVKSTDNEILKPDPPMATPAMDQLIGYITQHRGYDDWLLDLPSTLQNEGFDSVQMQKHEDPLYLMRYFYEMWIVTLEEFFTTVVKDAEQAERNLALIQESHLECKKGAAIRLGKLICIARKTVAAGK